MATEVDIPLIPGLRHVGPAPKVSTATASPIEGLRYVGEVPTVGGFAREAGKEIAKAGTKAAVASPLKGLGALQYSNQVQANKTLLYPMMRDVAAKLKDPSTRDEGIAELEGYRESWIYGLNKEQKAALDIAINNAKAGVTDPDKLLQQFEAVKPKPLEERAAYKAGAAIEKTVEEGLKRTPGYEEGKVGFALDIASAIGSTGGSVAQGLVLGPAGVLSASALQGIDEQLTRAKEAGLEGEEAAKFAVQGAGPGALGTLSTEYILRKIPPHARKALLKYGADILKSGVGEGVVEAVQQMAQNAIEQQYNKNRGIFDGTIYEGVLGGAAGMSVRAAVLAATRGRGVGGRTSEPPALQDVQKELAAEELRLREEESARKGSEKPGDEAKTPAKTPAEAADQGATKVEGKPVTVTLPGQDPWHGTETERFPDGGRRVVDREGVASTFYPDDDGVIEEGWKRITTEADAENTLKDWLSLEGQWQKVTVETTDGKIFRGIEGPADPGGGRIFRDGSGNLHGFASDAIREVEPGWEPGTPWTPDPVVGERAKEQSSAPSVTPEDQASPIQTEHIARGREVMADAVGTGKANTALEKAGLPNVGTYISLQDDNGDTIDGTINDATDGHVEILTRDGELITKSFEQAKPSLTVLPEFIRDRTEGRVEESDNTQNRREGPTSIQQRESARDTTQYQERPAEAPYPGVRDTEVQREAEEGQVVGAETQRQEAQATRERPEAEGVRGREQQEAIAQETKVKEDALKSWWDSADATSRRAATISGGFGQFGKTNFQVEGYVTKDWSSLPEHARVKIIDGNPGIVQSATTKSEATADTLPDAVTEWWDNLDDLKRRAALKKSGYSTEGMSNNQTREYAKRDWISLPEMVREKIVAGNPEAIAQSEVKAATPKTTSPEPKQEKKYGKDQEVLFGQRKEPQGRSEEERSGSRGDVEDKGSPNADRGPGPSDNAAQGDKREVTQDLAARAAKRRKELNIPEGVTVSDSGEPFAKAIFAQRAWKKRPKEEGPFEAEKVTGGWGYRRIGKARSEVKKVVSKIRKEPEARQEPTPDRVEKPAKPTKIESAEEAPKKKATTKKYDEKRNAVNAALREGLDRRGLTDIEVSTPDAISDIEGKKAIDDSTVAVGRTTGNLIEVALQGDHNYWQVMSHETIHVMKRLGLFKPVEWQALVNKAKADKRALADVRDRYAGESLTEDAIIEEVIAEQFGDYSAGINQPTGIFAKIYQKIKDFLSALDSALRGNGFMSASDVYAGIESGEIGSRPRDTEAQRERSETLIGQALGQLKDSSGGKALETKFARVSRGDFQFTHDMGLLRFWTISPRTVAAFSRSFARVYTAAKKQFATRDKTISELGKEYTEYRELSSSRKEKVNKVLELGRLTQRVFQASQNGTITVTAAQDTGLMKAGETVTLDAGEVAAYRSVRSMMDLAMDKYRDQIVRDFGLDPAVVNTPAQVMALVVPGTPRGQAKKLRTLAALLNDIRQAKRTGYIPFSRFGNMVVVAEQVDPATGQKTTLHSEVFEVKGVRGAWKRYRGLPEIAAKERELEQKYPGADIRTFQVASNEDNRKIGERDVLAELTQLQGPDLENRVQELFAEAQSKGFRKHFLGAKNIPGYSTDIEKAIADYVMSFSGFFARRQHHADWENAIKQIPKNKPRELRYANDYRDYVNNPQEEFAALRQTGFIMFLAGNFSNAVANLTQVPLISGPYLSLFSNPARVEFELARAYKDVALMFGNGKEIFNPNKAPRDVRNALKQAWDEGEFVPLAMHDIVGVAYNTKSSSSKISEAARGFVDGMAIPQTLSERANRLVTFIAAYRIAKRDPNFESKAKDILRDQQLAQEVLFTPTALGTDFSLQYAKFIVDETQYDAGKINRAKIMRKMGAAFLQFKPFILNTLELHYKTAVLHKKGFSTWAMMMFALLGAGGLRGLPASDDAMWALELFWKWWSGIDEDLKANIRKDVDEFTGSPFAAEMVLHGPVRALGIDMSDRIGMGKIVPRTMEEAGGIPVSLAWGRGLEFLGAYRDDRAAGMAMALMPLIARNIAQSWLWRKEGVRTQRGDPVMGPEEISDLDAAVKSLGFNPRTVAERREMEWAQARAGKATQEAKSRYYRKLAKLKIEAAEAANAGDDEKFKELIDKYQETISEIQAHNDKVLERKRYHQLIIIDKKALKRKMQEEIVGRGLVREKYVPKVARPRQQELREIYGATP
jgi:hypothetical protein